MWKHSVVIFMALFFLAGCRKRDDAGLYGNWEGSFQFSAKAPIDDPKGYLQFYLNDHKFKMRLGNKAQTFDASGTWLLKGTQVLLTFGDFTFEGVTKQEAHERKLGFLSPDDIRTAYGHTLILKLEPGGKELQGLPMTMAGTLGHHVFRKTALSSYK